MTLTSFECRVEVAGVLEWDSHRQCEGGHYLPDRTVGSGDGNGRSALKTSTMSSFWLCISHLHSRRQPYDRGKRDSMRDCSLRNQVSAALTPAQMKKMLCSRKAAGPLLVHLVVVAEPCVLFARQLGDEGKKGAWVRSHGHLHFFCSPQKHTTRQTMSELVSSRYW